MRKQVSLKAALEAEYAQRFAAEQRLELAIEAGGLGIWHWDVPAGKLEFNERWAKMLGYQLSDIPTSRDEWMSLVHPEDKAKMENLSFDLIKGDTTSNTASYRLRTAAGGWKWVLSFRKVVSHDENGKGKHITGIHLDIDSIKSKENELNEVSKEVVKKNIELEKFAYITSHNLRAPVVNLKSLTDIYEEEDLDEATRKDIFSKIRESVTRLDSTLNDLIEIVSNKGGEKIRFQTLEFETELKSVMASIEKQIAEANAEINFNFSEIETVHFSKRYLQSILLNLLTNAIKYRSKDRLLKINIKSYPHKDFIYLEFSDNGIGIDLDKFGNKIFGLYQRFHQDRDGKGLGLYLIKSQLEAMDGKIKVESKVGEGTTFKVLFYRPSYTKDQNSVIN